MNGGIDLKELLNQCGANVKTEFASTPDVIDAGHDLDVSKLAVTARRWLKVTDVVAVMADLKGSTKLGTGRWAASTASIYEAATGNVVRIFDRFEADFLQIQGDGVFGLFWGDKRFERALCAGITIKTFSVEFVRQLEEKWSDLKGKTGYKVGVASSRLLVKKIGTPRNLAQQEPIWAGKAVNYAAKAAQGADSNQMVVTGTVWDRAAGNDYLAFTCPCGGVSDSLWEDHRIERLPENDPEAMGRVLKSCWCNVHGAEYCNAILAGRKRRDHTDAARQVMESAHMKSAIWRKAEAERETRRARVKGLYR